MARNGRTKVSNQQTNGLFNSLKAVGYVRVSTDDQSTEGHSIEAQKERIKAYCKAKNIELVATYEDLGVSGTSDPNNREGMAAALSSIQKGLADTLIVVKNDRVARRATYQKDVIYGLTENGFGYVSISENVDTSTASGKLFLSMLAEFAEYEVELIRERTRSAIQHLKDTGQAHNKKMFGFKKVGSKKDGDKETRWEEIPEEQNIIKEIIRLYDSGLSWAKVVARIKEKFNRTMHRNTVRRIYLREKID
jgi:site-specific DNA recombinase